MKSLLTILLILSGIMFYSCKDNTIDPKDANDYVISISPEIVSTGDTVNIKIKKNELTNQSFRTFINLIEVDPISFTENNDNYLFKARIPTYAKNGEIWLQFNGTVYESNKKFKVYKIDTLLARVISKNEFEIKVFGYGLNYLKDSEFLFGSSRYSVTSISDTMLYFKFNMDATNINETFRIKRNSIIYQRNIMLKYDYIVEFEKLTIEFGNINCINKVKAYEGDPKFGVHFDTTYNENQLINKSIFDCKGFILSNAINNRFSLYKLRYSSERDSVIILMDAQNIKINLTTHYTSIENINSYGQEQQKWNIKCSNIGYTQHGDTLKALITNPELKNNLSLFFMGHGKLVKLGQTGSSSKYESTESYQLLDNAYISITFIKK
jgi:hypothetical protein